MIGLHSFELTKKEILTLLEDFEGFCLGKKGMTPEELKTLNENLSIGAIVHVGHNKFEKIGDEVHVIWHSPDHSVHNLGPLARLNVMRDCPGFHRTRSLALGHENVQSSGLMPVERLQTNISVVTMKDGTVGYGPNYKVALRNAALKMHLKSAFNKSGTNWFARLLGNA